MSEVKVVFNQNLHVQQFVVDVLHDKNNFVRYATAAIAKMIVEEGLLLTQTEYDIERGMYLTHCSLLKLGDEERT